MRIVPTAMMIVCLATPALAQAPHMNLWDSGKKALTADEVKAQEERENEFKSGVSKIPDQKASTDPWGNVRNTGTPQAKQKPPRESSK